MKLGTLLVDQLNNENIRAIEERISALAPQTGSLDLAQHALNMAIKAAALSSDALSRMTATHLLNLFHTQLNLIGLKHISSVQLQKFFEQLTEVLPPPQLSLTDSEACFVALCIREDPIYGIEFGPFDPRFLSATVFNITGMCEDQIMFTY